MTLTVPGGLGSDNSASKGDHSMANAAGRIFVGLVVTGLVHLAFPLAGVAQCGAAKSDGTTLACQPFESSSLFDDCRKQFIAGCNAAKPYDKGCLPRKTCSSCKWKVIDLRNNELKPGQYFR